MSVVDEPTQNLSLVAFHGPKTGDIDTYLQKVCLQAEQELVTAGLAPGDFKRYDFGQMHATVIGLECVVLGGSVVCAHLLNNTGKIARPRPKRLVRLVSSLAQARGPQPFLKIRFGGFRNAHCACTGLDLCSWDCKTSTAEFHSFRCSPYDRSIFCDGDKVFLVGFPIRGANSSAFPHYLYGLRQAAEAYGFMHKYHTPLKPFERDDEFYIRIGTMTAAAVSQPQKIKAWVDQLRAFLNTLNPEELIDVMADDLKIVYYEDTNLARISQDLPLPRAAGHPKLVSHLFTRWKHDH